MKFLPQLVVSLITVLITNVVALPSPDAGKIDIARRDPGQYDPTLVSNQCN